MSGTTPGVPDWRARLRAAVERSSRKHSAIAYEAGIAPATLSRILNGKHANPAFETVMRIARALNASVASLIDGQPGSAVPVPAVKIPGVYAARGARTVYRACGGSMRDAGITGGDLLFIQPVLTIPDAADRIVVCRIDGTVHMRYLTLAGNRIRLLSRNEGPAVMELHVREITRRAFELIGIVVGRMSG